MSEFTISVQELNFEIDVLCVILLGMLCVFVTHAIQRFVHNETSVSKYHAGIDMTIEATFTLSLCGLHTRRTCLLRSVGVVFGTNRQTKIVMLTGR